jgi:hypothetical protein
VYNYRGAWGEDRDWFDPRRAKGWHRDEAGQWRCQCGFVVHGSYDDDAEVDVLRRLLLRKECVVPTAHWFVAAKSMGLNFSFCRGVFVERGLRKLRAAAQ